MLKKIIGFGKKGIKQGIKKITKTKGPKPKLKRTTTTKNIGGGKKIVSSKADKAVNIGKKIVGPALVGGAITIAVNKKLRDRRDARAADRKTPATPKRKPKKPLAQGTSEKGRGKAGTKRNVLKRGNKFGGSGVVRNQGKAVKTGKDTAAYKKMMEKRKNK